MVKKTRLFKSNPFSEGHRVSLPSNFCLFDVDGILLDEERNPKFLYEEKFKMKYGDPEMDFIASFYTPENKQAFFLRFISEKIGIYLHEQKTNKWWFIKDRKLIETTNPNLDKVNTANRLYIEDIVNGYSHKLSGVFIRTEGEKPCEMETYSDFLCNLLNTPKVLVNDVFERDYIHFKREENLSKCEVDSRWEDTWKEMDII